MDEDDGRWIEAVSEYASTCDGCGELTMHENLEMNEVTQLGYCNECIKGEVKRRLTWKH
jgi:formylmethanofuran dehydrogenase subunit E